MNNDASIGLDETFEEQVGPAPAKPTLSPFSDRVPIGRGEYLVNLRDGVYEDGDYEDPYECPYWAYEGSGDCGGICVFTLDPDGGFKICCFGCDEEEQVCTTPMFGLRFYERLFQLTPYMYAVTECFDEYELTQSMSDSLSLRATKPELAELETLAEKDVEYGYIKVPSVSDPSRFLAVNLALGSSPLLLNMPSHGWRLHVVPNNLPVPTRPFSDAGHTVVNPSVTPTANIDKRDKALAATVILPEAHGAQQHWVVVPESSRHPQAPYRYSQLITARWTVTLYRLPIGRSKQKDSGCDCDD